MHLPFCCDYYASVLLSHPVAYHIKMKNLIFILALYSASSFADTPAQLIRILDGDTIEIRADVWEGVQITTKLRILGIDTAETRTKNLCEKKKGLTAKEYLKNYLEGKALSVENIKYGKFAGRVLGDLKADGKDVGNIMIKSGHARPYFGGKRGKWCIKTGVIK